MILASGRLPLAALLLVALPQAALAARTPDGHGDEVLRGTDGRAVQRQRAVAFRSSTPPSSTPRRAAAVAAMRAELGRSWIAWDDATALPHRIMLEGVEAPGVMTSSSTAAAFATAVLERHLAALAPHARASDFVLVANDLSGGIRSVGFAQHHRGVPVQGGQISFRFKNDRLVLVANDALPIVDVRSASLAAPTAKMAARDWIAAAIPGARPVAGEAEAPIVIPLSVDGRLAYHEVRRVEVEVDAPRGRWSVFVDTHTGKPVARRQDLMFTTAGVVYRVPVRSPQGERGDYGAPFVELDVDGVSLLTDAGGVFDFATTPGLTSNSPVGPFVAVSNAGGPLASQSFVASPGSGTVWNGGDDEFVDAQLAAFIHTSRVKAYVRGIDPALAWLDTQIPVTVNIDDTCNAFSDGNSINFFRAGDCENTGLIADVVYHEFGHSVHTQALIDGVGFFDTALSEGISDYLSMTIVDDPGVGRGFFYDDTPLRDLDPPDFEYRWPEDRGEVHDEGRIIAGALWDLRKLMVAKYGAAGVFATDRIWYESTRRSVDIPSMYLEALVVDDDDGNLANGTPNVCEINAAYGAHGLFSAGEAAESVSIVQGPDGIVVDLQAALPNYPQCPVGASPVLSWQVRGTGAVSETDMSPGSNGGWTATIPPQGAGTVVQYKVDVNYDNGTARSMPDNFVDPWYEVFVGPTIPLYCTDFTDGAAGWSLVGDWDVSAPQGTAGNRDPFASFDADGTVLGNTLSSDGLYQPGTSAVASLPPVSTLGFTNVRLQYRRWLTVEDGFFDQAQIVVDGETAWAQYASQVDVFATLHHVDREWRFQDVDLSAAAQDGTVEVEFTLDSDGGLEFGGWTVDSLCVVALDPAASLCGNGVLDGVEACDDGNVVGGDGCDPLCALEPVDPGTTDDGGSDGTGDDASSSGDDGGLDADGGLLGRGCRCDADAGGGPAWIGLVLPLWWLRRRRAR